MLIPNGQVNCKDGGDQWRGLYLSDVSV